jgi:hypothetical protein
VIQTKTELAETLLPSLRDSVPPYLTYPGLTSWANIWRRYAAGIWWLARIVADGEAVWMMAAFCREIPRSA